MIAFDFFGENMINKIIGLSLGVVSLCTLAQPYGGLGVTAAKLSDKISSENTEISTTALRAIFGYKVNPKLAVEGVAAFGLSNSTFNVATAPNSKLNIDYIVGVYAKPTFKITPQLEAFFRAGMAQTQTTLFYQGNTIKTTNNGLSYGLGLSYELGKTTFFNLDYMFYVNNDRTKATGLTAGFDYLF